MSPMNCGTCKKPTWRQWGVLVRTKAQDPRLQNDDKVTIQNAEAEKEQNSRDTDEHQRFQQCRGAMGMDESMCGETTNQENHQWVVKLNYNFYFAI